MNTQTKPVAVVDEPDAMARSASASVTPEDAAAALAAKREAALELKRARHLGNLAARWAKKFMRRTRVRYETRIARKITSRTRKNNMH